MSIRAVSLGLLMAIGLAACGQAAQAPVVETPGAVATSAVQGATAVGTVEGHFNPTEAVGGGANSSSSVSNLTNIFAALPQANQLQISANASPPGATGPDVTSVSIVAQDRGGLLKGLDATGKQSLGEALLTAAGGAWPNATISLLVTGTGAQIMGSRPKGGPNSIIAT